MSYYGIRPINRSCGSYGCHCPPNDGRQNTADMPAQPRGVIEGITTYCPRTTRWPR
jgi:hypothetical protein